MNDKITAKAGGARGLLGGLLALLLGLGLLPQAIAGVTVTLTAPANGASYTAPASITLSATANATQGYTLSKVEFFHSGTTLIATDTTSPYSFNWSNVPAGSYTLTAVATAVKKNSPNQTATSAPVSITVNAPNVPPTVSLTSPANGASFNAPAAVTLTATAADSDGTISKVEFFHGGTNLIATVTSPPYTHNWTGVAAGAYTLTARATDNQNGTTTSAPVGITVNQVAALYFIHSDHLNTPRLITDQVGRAVWQWDHADPFGNNAPNENPSGLGTFTCNLRLPGQYFDQETNTHYNYFRDYDPQIGRYIQSDPIGLQGGINTYAYVGNNPLTSADPSGLACVSVGGRTTCTVPGGPTFTVPTPLGFPTMLGANDDFYHFYRVQRSIGCASPQGVLSGLINNPTPGVPLLATPQGTPNNAVVLGVNNSVTSYLTVDVTSGAAIVVNIAGTGGGAAFGPGYVARYVSGGQAITAGEGTNWKQSPAVTGSAFQNAANEALWGQQMNRIIQQCGCQR